MVALSAADGVEDTVGLREGKLTGTADVNENRTHYQMQQSAYDGPAEVARLCVVGVEFARSPTDLGETPLCGVYPTILKILTAVSISGTATRRVGRAGFSRNPTATRNRRNQKEKTMRFMVLVKANKESEAGVLPSQEMLTE